MYLADFLFQGKRYVRDVQSPYANWIREKRR